MTSKLERYLSKELYARFGHLSIRQNYHPDWLNGLELDFYIDELKLAAEVQGDQHYRFVEHFHRTAENFEAQKDRDALKSILCRENKISLCEIFTEKDADLFVLRIKEITKEKNKPFRTPKTKFMTQAEEQKKRERNKTIQSKTRKQYKKTWGVS